MKKVLLFILLLFLFPTPVYANILCNDGTYSPTCQDCHQGCCSHHGGCASDYYYSDDNDHDYDDDYDDYYPEHIFNKNYSFGDMVAATLAGGTVVATAVGIYSDHKKKKKK